MKLLISYLSLLIFCGLVIPFYTNIIANKFTRPVSAKAFQEKPRQHIDNKSKAISFSFLEDVAANIFPVLKSLN